MQDIEFTTPITQTKVTLRPYVTGAIDAELQKIMLDANEYRLDMKSEPGQSSDSSSRDIQAIVRPSVQLDADRKTIELMVTSVDGKTENVADLVYALPKGDTEAVKVRINQINEASKVSPEQKKTSSVTISQP